MKKLFPDLKFSLLLCLFYVFALFFLVSFFGFSGSQGLVIIVSTTVPALAVIMISAGVNKIPFLEAMGWGDIKKDKILPIVLMTISLSILISEVDNIMAEYLISSAQYEKYLLQLMKLFPKDRPGDLIISVLTVAAIGPFVEEGVFRGVIFKGIASNMGNSAGIFASSLLFMVIHLNPVQFPGALILGIIYSILLSRGYKTSDTFIAHAVHNSISLIFLLGFIYMPGMSISNAVSISHVPIWLIAISTLVFIISIRYLLRNDT